MVKHFLLPLIVTCRRNQADLSSRVMTEQIVDKKKFSASRIGQLKEKLSSSENLSKQQDLCIYATGSYGRLEAGTTSDIDLFFLKKSDDGGITKISKILIDANIIESCRGMGFPEFSGDGEYLEIHDVNDMHKELGGRNDDYYNYFTARILLLLESKPIYNEELYYSLVKDIINKYYTDFEKHESEFEPIFLVNDVIRFWRTLCLNYEHKRHEKIKNKTLVKEKSDIKNIKLKFSRKLTCFSFLISVLYSTNKVLSQSDVLEIIKMTPMERIEKIAKENLENKQFSDIMQLYSWFLENFQIEEDKLLIWIKNSDNRAQAFIKAGEFGKAIFDVMISANNHARLQFFLA
jgi:hypothetical protein